MRALWPGVVVGKGFGTTGGFGTFGGVFGGGDFGGGDFGGSSSIFSPDSLSESSPEASLPRCDFLSSSSDTVEVVISPLSFSSSSSSSA